MEKINWGTIWKSAIQSAIAIILDYAVVDVIKLQNGWIILLISIVLFFVLLAIVHIVFMVFENIYLWLKSPNPQRVKLYANSLDDNTVSLALLNKENSHPKIWVNRLQIANNPFTWLIYSAAMFSLDTDKSRDIFLIKWHKEKRYFTISESNINDDTEKVFGYGEYKFNVQIRYGFTEEKSVLFPTKSSNLLIKNFYTKISLDENGVIKVLEIKHGD